MLKTLVKQRKHYLPLARKSLKNQENIKRKRETGNILQKREVLCQNGRVGISTVYLRTILVITFHKLLQQHSGRLSLQSSETKSHQHLNIKAFVFLNPCPQLINVLIWVTLKSIPQMPVNTCVRSNVPKCTQKFLRERSPPSWIRTNPLLMPHIPQEKCDKTRESPHTLGTRRGANIVIKPH